MDIVYNTGKLWTRHKGIPQPDVIQKLSELLSGDAPGGHPVESERKKGKTVIIGFFLLLTSTEIRFINCLEN